MSLLHFFVVRPTVLEVHVGDQEEESQADVESNRSNQPGDKFKIIISILDTV
jgi:hypothetical protein